MIVSLLRNLKGYVRISLRGFSPERFLNLCSNHNILIWDLSSGSDDYQMCMSIKGFRKLKPILRKTETRIKILERHGLPFFLHKYRRRKPFFFSVLLFVGLVFMLSRYIWNIHVYGNYSRTTEVILEYLEEEEIVHGIAKGKVDCQEIARLLRAEFDDIIWVSARIQGTRLVIQVQENTDTVVAADKEYEPSDLVANRAGTVTQIITRSGVPQVEVGDAVEEGDLLVQGRLEILNDNKEVVSYEYCTADADVYVETKYDYADEFAVFYHDKVYTGNTKKSYVVTLFGHQLHLYGKKADYPYSDATVNHHQLRITENFYLPAELSVEQEREYTLEDKELTKEEAKVIAEENLTIFNEKLKEKGVQISENDVKIESDGKNYYVKGTITVIEKIGKLISTELLEVPEERTAQDEYN